MPEGPEVETIRRGLETSIISQTFSGVEVLAPKSFFVPQDEIAQSVIGAKVSRVVRHGKVLEMTLDNGFSLLAHLKMTGQMVLVRADGQRVAGGHPTLSMAGELPDNSTRVVFEFTSGDKLFFNDQRRFGWIKLVPSTQTALDSLIRRLGPDATSPEFTLKYFRGSLTRRPKSLIKAAILDQSVVAGIGNIYADESLHLAKIHPARRVGSLTSAEQKRLHQAIITIIQSGIEHGGSSFSSYVDAMGGKGDYLQMARVFRRTGLACPKCAGEIVKLRVAGRGTHICPKCQKENVR